MVEPVTRPGIEVSRDGPVATVSLSNPDKLNAVTAAMWRELAVVMGALSADDGLRCVVVRGAGSKAFAAGGDIEEFRTLRATRPLAEAYHDDVARALHALRDCVHPTVAMIRGACVGGGLEIAAMCDLRIAGQGAVFGAPINRLGFSMAWRELAAVLSVAGPALALEILLEGRLLTAVEAAAKGLVTRMVADEVLEQEVSACAARICAGAPLVARTHKWLVRRLAQDGSPLTPAEIDRSFGWLDSADYQAGLAAFTARTKPEFKGR